GVAIGWDGEAVRRPQTSLFNGLYRLPHESFGATTNMKEDACFWADPAPVFRCLRAGIVSGRLTLGIRNRQRSGRDSVERRGRATHESAVAASALIPHRGRRAIFLPRAEHGG